MNIIELDVRAGSTGAMGSAMVFTLSFGMERLQVIRLSDIDYRDRIRGLREDRDLNQTQVGKLLQKSQQGYSHIENGRAELKIDDLALLCRFYDVSADYIIGLVNEPRSYRPAHQKTK